jgi:hypothetical protein
MDKQQTEINNTQEDAEEAAQELRSSILEEVQHLKQLSLEGSQSPETILRIAKLLKMSFESLIERQMIDPQNTTFAEAIEEVDSLIVRYKKLR